MRAMTVLRPSWRCNSRISIALSSRSLASRWTALVEQQHIRRIASGARCTRALPADSGAAGAPRILPPTRRSASFALPRARFASLPSQSRMRRSGAVICGNSAELWNTSVVAPPWRQVLRRAVRGHGSAARSTSRIHAQVGSCHTQGPSSTRIRRRRRRAHPRPRGSPSASTGSDPPSAPWSTTWPFSRSGRSRSSDA